MVSSKKRRKDPLMPFAKFFDEVDIPFRGTYDSRGRLTEIRTKLAFEMSGKRACTISLIEEMILIEVRAGKLGRKHPSGAFPVIEMLTNYRVELHGRKLEWILTFPQELFANNGDVYGVFVEIDKDISVVRDTLKYLSTGKGHQAPFLSVGTPGTA